MENKEREENIQDIENIKEILYYLQEKGIKLQIQNNKIKYTGAKEIITKDLLNLIKINKNRIIKYIKESNSQNTNDSYIVPLTSIQFAYLIGRDEANELGGVGSHYYIEYECSDIDIDKFESCFNEVIRRNEILRTKINVQGYQEILQEVPQFKIKVINIETQQQFKDIRSKMSHYKYEIGKWPMFNIQLSKSQNEYNVLHISFDCMILDAWSAKLMLAQIFKLYNNQNINWTNLTFREYLKKSKEFLKENNNYDEAEEYWKQKLSQLPKAPQLPYNVDIRQIRNHHFRRLKYKLSESESKIFYERASDNHITPTTLLCTIFMKVLAFFSSEKSLTLNTTLYNRISINKDVKKILGDFTNIGLVSYEYNDEVFIEELKEVQQQFWKLIIYRTYDGLLLLKKLSFNKQGKAIMPVVFTSLLQNNRTKESIFSIPYREVYAISQTPQVSLDHQAHDVNGSILISWDYVIEAFDKEVIERIFEKYMYMIKYIIHEENWNRKIKIIDS